MTLLPTHSSVVYPNYEVAQAFQCHLLADYLKLATGRITASFLSRLSTAAVALQQIKDRDYALAYLHRGKPVVLLGIAFDQEQRNVAEWQTAVV